MPFKSNVILEIKIVREVFCIRLCDRNFWSVRSQYIQEREDETLQFVLATSVHCACTPLIGLIIPPVKTKKSRNTLNANERVGRKTTRFSKNG